MEKRLLTFDPDGDVLLRFQAPAEYHFESPDTNEVEPPVTPDHGHPFHPLLSPSCLSESSTAIDDEFSDFSSFGPCVSAQTREITMRVSSKHLGLASPVFKSMFSEGMFEGEKLMVGEETVVAMDGDAQVWEVLMNVVHGRIRMVPVQVTLEMLDGLAILVDKYQMLEVVEMFVKSWMPQLKTSIPRSLTPELLSWLRIAWVFRLPREFKHGTRIAQLEANGRLGYEGDERPLPLPDHILDEIERHRQKGISELLGCIKKVASTYDGSKVNCRKNYSEHTDLKRYACDGLILGTLLKSASSAGLLPIPEAPYVGMSVRQTADKVRGLKIMGMCDEILTMYSMTAPLDAHGCVDWIRDRCAKVEQAQQGLNFELLAIQSAISNMQKSLSRQE
ncbi:uncharacterized protein L3040_005626 [Drepanopeziza brunnea f. sp. 'multigermtubi']|uniref:uncharacterized protein n=1 Tax=Drepanopeziza brunnea f. sp. 'multigermtubi' TaxID=698441 RepID=UPI00238C69DD|nr:hypothetical protein L3040_005626 [Drepanopeziza brunnea f. sp. 'multigermtubi']